jgi:hypothetical protein
MEARTIADHLTDPELKLKMLRIADEYEELARRAKKRLRDTNKGTLIEPVAVYCVCPV